MTGPAGTRLHWLGTKLADKQGGKAGEEIRTLDINLGKVALYQLSYARTAPNPSRVRQPVKGTL